MTLRAPRILAAGVLALGLATTAIGTVSCKQRGFNSDVKKRTGDNLDGAENEILKEYQALNDFYSQLDAKAAGGAGAPAGVTSKRWVFKILTFPAGLSKAAMARLGWSSPDPREAAVEEFKKASASNPKAFKTTYQDRTKTTLKPSDPGNKVVSETLTGFFCRFLMGTGTDARSLNCRKRQYIEYEMIGHSDLEEHIPFTGKTHQVNLSGGVLSQPLSTQIYGMEFKSVFEKAKATGGEEAALELKPRLAHTSWDHDFILSAKGQDALRDILVDQGKFRISERVTPYMRKWGEADLEKNLRAELKAALDKAKAQASKSGTDVMVAKMYIRQFLFDNAKVEALLRNHQDMSGDAVFNRTVILNAVVGNAFDISSAKAGYGATFNMGANYSGEDFEKAFQQLKFTYLKGRDAATAAAEEGALKLQANSRFVNALLKQFAHDSLDEIYQMRYYRVGGELVTESGEAVQFTHDSQVRAFVPVGQKVDPATGFPVTAYEEIDPKHLGDVADPKMVKCEVKVSDKLMTKLRSGEPLSAGEQNVYGFLKKLHEPELMVQGGKGKNSPLMQAMADNLSKMFGTKKTKDLNLDPKYTDDPDLDEATRKRLAEALENGRKLGTDDTKVKGSHIGARLIEFLNMAKVQGLFRDVARDI